VLGLKIAEPAAGARGRPHRHAPELVGHYAHNRLHGGVISAGLDAMGGLAVMAAIGARHMDERRCSGCTASPSWAPSTCASTTCGRPSASAFELRAEVLRLGSRVASTRMEFLGADGA
jgi:acyl-coenzyme A thioesterase PaaI-like protein